MKPVSPLPVGLSLAAGAAMAQPTLPQTPGELHAQWEVAFNANDLTWRCALYSDDAVVQRQDSTTAAGRIQFCADLEQLFGFAQSIRFNTACVLEGTDTAVLRSRYVVTIFDEYEQA